MKLTKIAEKTYTFNDATVTSVYNKADRLFIFNINRIGYCASISIQKSILTMSNEIESIYNGMKPIEIESTVDIDSDLTDEELALAQFIRFYNPDQDEVISVKEIGETHDEVLIALNQYLTTETEEDYVSFLDSLPVKEELVTI